MSEITSMSRLSFFKVNKYEYKNNHTSDFSSYPRPHFCMGLIIKGEGVFTSKSGSICVKKGDIIFVPITSEYISRWSGNPDIEYISMHFSFDAGSLFSSKKIFEIQRVTLPEYDKIKENFYLALNYCDGTEVQKLNALSIFYSIISQILPHLKFDEPKSMDKRIERAVEYIDFHYSEDFPTSTLSNLCSMSESHFYACFKKAMGITPVEYRLKVRIDHGILLLIDNNGRNIEEISEILGFESSVYFRRVFKQITGMSPREYRKTAVEY